MHDGSQGSISGQSWGRWAIGLAAAAVLLFHSLFLPLGAWAADEYVLFSFFRRFGWSVVPERIASWSPRPVSEVLLYLYGQVVAWQGAPHVAWMLGITWATTLTVLVAASRTARLGTIPGLALCASALVVASPGGMWFWPAGAVAYLPAFAGLGAAALLLAGGTPGRGAAVFLAIALVLAAGSAEVGAVPVFLLGVAQLLRHALARPWPWIRPEEPAWAWMPAVMLAAYVIAIMATHRAALGTEVLVAGPIVGNLRLSVLAGLPALGRSIPGVPLEPGGIASITFGAPIKLALVAGFWALLPAIPRPSGRRLTCLLALAAIGAAATISIVFAFRQFGTLCCARHEAFRQAEWVIAALLLAVLLPPGRAALRRAAPWAMAAVLVGMVGLRWPLLKADRALIPAILETRAENWANGRTPGQAMGFRSEPQGRLTGVRWVLPTGVYRRPDDGTNKPREMDMHAFAVLLFFRKLELHNE